MPPKLTVESVIEEFENIFVYLEELSEGFERPIGSQPSFRKEIKAEHMGDVLRLVREGKDWLHTILEAKDAERERAVEEAHQAVIEEVVRVIEGRMEEWAALEHDRWRRWQRWVHSQSEPVPHNTDMPHCFCNPKKIVVENGNMSIVHSEFSPLVIPFELVARWERQIATPYAELSEAEKESDREQVRPYITDLITKLTNPNAQ